VIEFKRETRAFHYLNERDRAKKMNWELEYQRQREDILDRYNRDKQSFYLLSPERIRDIRESYNRQINYIERIHYSPITMSVLGKRRYSGYYYPQQQKRQFVRVGGARQPLTEEQRLRMALMRQRAIQRRFPANLRSLSGEVKSLDFPGGTTTIDTTGSIGALNLIQSGSGFYNRIGRRIEMKSIHFKGNITPTANQATVTDYIRIVLIYDRQTNGAYPAIGDILQSTDQAGANTTNCYSGLNMNYRDRFSILRDMKIVIPECTNTAGVISTTMAIDPTKPLNNLEFFVKLKGLLTQYRADSNPAVIGDIATGALYLVLLGNVANATAQWQLSFQTRLRYNDN